MQRIDNIKSWFFVKIKNFYSVVWKKERERGSKLIKLKMKGELLKKEKEENQEINKDIFKSLFASKLKILNRHEVISLYIQYTKIKL